MMKARVIKTEADYERTLARIETLMDAESGTPEMDELEVLSVLVEKYEDERYPVDVPDPIVAIRFRMEQQGLTNRDLEAYLGSQARVSEVLNGKRALSKEMIRRLHNGLGIPAEVLLQEPSRTPGRGYTQSEGAMRTARMVGEGKAEGDEDAE